MMEKSWIVIAKTDERERIALVPVRVPVTATV